MDETSGSHDMLFPTSSSSVERDYLAFLAQRVPKDIADQLYDDGEPDIGMPHATVDIADLIHPLSSRAFPAAKLDDMAAMMGYIVMGYERGVETNESECDPYKSIYAASLYLWCCVRGGEGSGYLSALRIMATVPVKLDVESRLQVCRFLASLVPILRGVPTVGEAPLSSLMLALSVIVGSVVSDLSIVAEHTMKSERLVQAWSELQAWSKAQERSDSPEMAEAWRFFSHRISAIRQLLLETYGASGTVRQAASRFLLAVTEGENHTAGNP